MQESEQSLQDEQAEVQAQMHAVCLTRDEAVALHEAVGDLFAKPETLPARCHEDRLTYTRAVRAYAKLKQAAADQ